jgi:hypothetical protein
MLRAMLASLAILSVASFELVSQSFEGTMTMTTSTPGVPSPKLAFIKMGLDVDGTLKFGTSMHIVMDMPQYNTPIEINASAIFDATTKRYTMYSESWFYDATTSSSPLPNPNPTATCKFIEIATLPAPEDFAKCINDITAPFQPIASEDGLQKYELKMSIPEANSTVSEDIYTDKDFVIKKFSFEEINLPNNPTMRTHTEVIDMNAKAGAPDASFFMVPKEWGECTEESMSPLQMSMMLKGFMHCIGQGKQKPFVMV